MFGRILLIKIDIQNGSLCTSDILNLRLRPILTSNGHQMMISSIMTTSITTMRQVSKSLLAEINSSLDGMVNKHTLTLILERDLSEMQKISPIQMMYSELEQELKNSRNQMLALHQQMLILL